MKSLLIFLSVAAITATAYQIPYYIFMDCYDPICRLNDMYGFHCKNGLCSYVCNAGGCRSGGLPTRSMLGSSNLIFYGCENPVCAMDGFYGYGCNDGACQFICSDGGCYEGTRVNPQSRKTRRNGKKRLTEKYTKLQEEIGSREKNEKEKTKETTTTLALVSTTVTTAEPPSTTHKVVIANVETETSTDEILTTISTPKENRTTTITKPSDTLKYNAEISKETSESKPEEKKKQPRQATRKDKKEENETAETAKKENKKEKKKMN